MFTDTRNVIKINKGVFVYMKATGIVRRIDDLGRVVIPKEIRKTMRMREGGLGCRLGQCFCFAEVSTGRTPSLTTLTQIDKFCWAIHSVVERYKKIAERKSLCYLRFVFGFHQNYEIVNYQYKASRYKQTTFGNLFVRILWIHMNFDSASYFIIR